MLEDEEYIYSEEFLERFGPILDDIKIDSVNIQIAKGSDHHIIGISRNLEQKWSKDLQRFKISGH